MTMTTTDVTSEPPTETASVPPPAIDELAGRFLGQIITPRDANYDEARSTWNGLIDKRPAVIAKCLGNSDIVAALAFAKEHGLPLAVRGGGHGVAGYGVCDDGIVIDLSLMRGVRVDPNNRTVRVQGGATVADLDRETQMFGLATPSGNVSTTGVAGLTLSGGLSHLRRKHGMSVDNLLSADVVTAAGEILTANANENAGLFWAIRGGGGNFGIVSSFEFRLHEVGPLVSLAMVMYPLEMGREVLRFWRDFNESAPDEVTSDAIIWKVPPAPMFPPEIHGRSIMAIAAVHCGDTAEGERVLAPLRQIGTPLFDMSGPLPWVALQSAFDEPFPAGLRYYWKSLYLDDMSDQTIEAILERTADRPSDMTFIPIRHLGGAIERVSDAETAVANRAAPYLLSLDNAWVDPAADERNVAWVRSFWTAMQAHSQGGVYLNFAGTRDEGAAMAKAGHRANYDRLAALKAAYDPENLFRLNNNVRPAG